MYNLKSETHKLLLWVNVIKVQVVFTLDFFHHLQREKTKNFVTYSQHEPKYVLCNGKSGVPLATCCLVLFVQVSREWLT